ncbi:DUF4133 domain-containing protein [Sphingobacterium sp.]|uniref:DUF4133 domain-containing protein n=1 Tax=Sphingobacterium sp. TaxID=341027 RepID=UPI003917C311
MEQWGSRYRKGCRRMVRELCVPCGGYNGHRVILWNQLTMGNSVYRIHRDLNKPIEFHGLTPQYIGLLVLGLSFITAIFLVSYYSGVSRIYGISGLILLGTAWAVQVQRWENRYGQYGLLKSYARRKLPRSVRLRGRGIFIFLKSREGR